MLRILQISPTYFSDQSMLGGGERYPSALAKELALQAKVKLISFGPESREGDVDGVPLQIYRSSLLRGSILNPFNLSFMREFFQADVLHCHQICTLVSDQTCLVGRLLGKRVFLTDHGGGTEMILHRRLPWIHDEATVVLQSEFTRAFIPSRLRQRAVVVKGGVDTTRYFPDPQVERDGTVLFVGRILPHKGINYLVEAFRQLDRGDFKLKIMGRVHDQRYYTDLKKRAEGLKVEFIHDATDREVAQAYRQAFITVLPSVHTDIYGGYTATPELMGFTLLEAQACGTPVICTDAGAMPEFVQDRVTGRVVKPNSAEALLEGIQSIFDLSRPDYEKMSQNASGWAETFSWKNVVAAHLKLYQTK